MSYKGQLATTPNEQGIYTLPYKCHEPGGNIELEKF
jgi:hypothetical protein